MRYFIRFSYHGSDFHGSQVQPNGITVQEVLEQAFATLLRHEVPLTFAGRTDAGVHALKMIAHFDEPAVWDAGQRQTLCHRLNGLLPASVAVRAIYPVCDEAHARFSATARTYRYFLTTRKEPFLGDRTARVTDTLDFEAMNRTAARMLGTHDFKSFCRSHAACKTTLCTVTRAEWSRRFAVDEGLEYEYVFTITADRFLRNMVRAVVGTLLEVGRGKMTEADFQAVVDAKNRCAAGQSAPSEGLFLTDIRYPEELLIENPEQP